MTTDTGAESTKSDVKNGQDGLIRRIPYAYRKRIYKAAIVISAATIAILMIFPLYWMAQTAFTTRSGVLGGVTFLPTAETFTLSRFDIITTPQVGLYLLNSAIVTLGTVILVNIISFISGYGLSRFSFRGKFTFARVLLFGYMFSPIVLALPLFMMWRSVGLINTRIGLIIALSALSMPFSVWMMWKYMQTISLSYEESAWIAGASRWRSVFEIVLPQAKPAIVAVSIFSFAIAWNDFTFAKILLPNKSVTTFPPGMLRLIQQGMATQWGDIMAVGVVVTIPPLLFAYFLQSYLMEGFRISNL
jgi:multiple sugar transport system permease protein